MVKIEVRDTGVGISSSRLQTLFEEGKEGEGVRLGLAVTKRLVEAHHGTLIVASEPGAGST